MWPWEHLAFGYLLYSAWTRARHRVRPDDAGVIVLAVASQLPDLVDKPLAWGVHVLPGGRTLAHSLTVAVPLIAGVYAVADRRGTPSLGLAFAVGYLSHLLGDAVSTVLFGRIVDLDFLLWPIIPAESGAAVPSGHVLSLVLDYLSYVTSPAGLGYVLFQGLFLGLALRVWLVDGAPAGLRYWADRAKYD